MARKEFMFFHTERTFAQDLDPASDIDMAIFALPATPGTLAKVEAPSVAAVTESLDLTTVANHAVALPLPVGVSCLPSRVVVSCNAIMTGDSKIKVGTSAGGEQILAETTLTGLTAVGTSLVVPLSGVLPRLAGNATVYVRVSGVDTSVGALATVRVEATPVG
jgi:hypothetical protein